MNNKQKDGIYYTVLFLIGFYFAASYLFNAGKLLFEDDWESPHKAEVVHTIGLVIPIFSTITVWVDDEVEDE